MSSFSSPRLLIALTFLSLFGIGCLSSSSRVPTPVADEPSAAAPAAAPASLRSACEHPYYPIRDGYSVTFKDSFNSLIDGRPTVDHYTWRATNVGPTSAKLDVVFASTGLHSTQELTCQNGALMARAYVDLSSSNRAFKVETTAASGEYLPRDFVVGSVWQQSYTILMKPTGAPRAGDLGSTPDMHGTVTINHQAVAEERVTVPAGTYTAIKVKSSMTMKLDAVRGGLSAELPGVQIESIEWWVRGVGLVKAHTQMGAGYTAMSEAETVVIP